MPILSDNEARELNLRMLTGQPQLQELTWRSVRAHTVAVAAQVAQEDPQQAERAGQWLDASIDFWGAAAVYRTASDALMAFASCDLWPEYNGTVGRHLLRLCQAWEKAPASERGRVEEMVKRVQYAIGLLPFAKPQDGFSARQMRERRLLQALRETGWDQEADHEQERRERVMRGGVRRAGARPEERKKEAGRPGGARKGGVDAGSRSGAGKKKGR